MNLKFGKSLTYIVHIVFTIAFIVHISIVVFSIFNPEIPDVETSEKHLKDIAFPFSFRLCVHKLVDTNKKYWDSGYYNYYAFYKGRSLYNKSLYGFSGHLTNGSTKFNTYEGFLDIKCSFPFLKVAPLELQENISFVDGLSNVIMKEIIILTTEQKKFKIKGPETRKLWQSSERMDKNNRIKYKSHHCKHS